MRTMIKLFIFLLLASSAGLVYTIFNFTQLLEDVDFFNEDEDNE